MADAKGLDVLVIGERINARRKRIDIAVRSRDDDYIAREAHDQAEAGANYIDLNGGSKPDREIDNLKCETSIDERLKILEFAKTLSGKSPISLHAKSSQLPQCAFWSQTGCQIPVLKANTKGK